MNKFIRAIPIGIFGGFYGGYVNYINVNHIVGVYKHIVTDYKYGVQKVEQEIATAIVYMGEKIVEFEIGLKDYEVLVNGIK